MNEEINAPMATHLMEAKIRVKRNQECAKEVKRLVDFNDESMICGYEFKKDACQVLRKTFGTRTFFEKLFTGRFRKSVFH